MKEKLGPITTGITTTKTKAKTQTETEIARHHDVNSIPLDAVPRDKN